MQQVLISVRYTIQEEVKDRLWEKVSDKMCYSLCKEIRTKLDSNTSYDIWDDFLGGSMGEVRRQFKYE